MSSSSSEDDDEQLHHSGGDEAAVDEAALGRPGALVNVNRTMWEVLRKKGIWIDGVQAARPGAETERFLKFKQIGVDLMFSGSKMKEWKYEERDIYEVAVRKVWLLTGMRGVGKTTFITDWLYRHRQIFPWGVIVSHTKQNGHFQQFWPNKMILSRYSDSVLQELFEIGIERKMTPGINSLFAVVLDDIISDASLRYYRSLKAVSTEGRHANFTCLATSQHFKSIPNHVRDNTDFFVLFTTTNREVLNSMYDEMGGHFTSREEFFVFIEANTRDDQVIIVENNKYKRGLERWYTYKVPDATLGWDKRFTCLCPTAWGGDRGGVVAEQRRMWKEPIDYTLLTLLRMKNKSQMSKEDADKALSKKGKKYAEEPFGIIKQ